MTFLSLLGNINRMTVRGYEEVEDCKHDISSASDCMDTGNTESQSYSEMKDTVVENPIIASGLGEGNETCI
jgi:hypothetical protein